MSKIASDLEPMATAAQIRKAASKLKELATRLELSDLRLSEDGTIVLHVDSDLGHRPVIRFLNQATRLMGAEPYVVTDCAPGASRYRTSPL